MTPKRANIHVQFLGGNTYAYEEVSEEMYQEFRQSSP